jgi:uncharacterized protein (TIGR02246 family)
MNVERRVARIEAMDEIRQLTARYCHAVVDGDAKTIVGLFCPDGVFRAHKVHPTGHQELLAFYAAAVGGKTHKPFIQNHVIDFIDETHAQGRCSVEIRILQGNEAYTQAGHYQDKYRKVTSECIGDSASNSASDSGADTPGIWRFQERHYFRYHNVPWRTGWTK